MNGADGISDIEGKVARVSGEGVGKRPSFKFVAKTLQTQKKAAVTDPRLQLDHIRVPGHHQLEKSNGTHQWSRALFKDRDHVIEKWETLNPDGTKTQFQFELTRKM